MFTVSINNASSNDGAITYLKKLTNWNELVLDKDMMHMPCYAYILNLVVKEGLKDYHDFISTKRHIVWNVRSSPSRLGKFKKSMVVENITRKGLVYLDIATRWNSTYRMLKLVNKFQKAFGRLEEDDRDFQSYFQEYRS